MYHSKIDEGSKYSSIYLPEGFCSQAEQCDVGEMPDNIIIVKQICIILLERIQVGMSCTCAYQDSTLAQGPALYVIGR